MFKRPYVLAVVSFLVIPAVTVLAGVLINSIDPEIAVALPITNKIFGC